MLLTACGGGGGGSSDADPQPNTPPGSTPAATLTLSASQTSVDAGDSVSLSWQTTDADSCTASGGWSGSRATSGSETVGPLTQTTTYSLSCSGAGGGALDNVTVQVAGSGPVSVSLSSDQDVVFEDGQVELTWQSNGAQSCSASGDWSGSRDTSGAFTTPPLTADASFTLSCSSGSGDTAVALVSITVTDKFVRWQAPTQNVDGTDLVDLTSYNLYYGQSSRDYDSSISLPASTTQWEITLPTGSYFFALTAIDGDQNESGFSNEITRTVP